MIEKLKEAMNELNEFAENNYKNGDDPAIRAEYKSLYLNYLRIFVEANEKGFDVNIQNSSNLQGKEFDDMMKWERELGGKIQAQLQTHGIPEKN